MKNVIAFFCLSFSFATSDCYKSYEERLLNAAIEKSEELIYTHVNNGADVNFKGSQGWTALMEIAEGKVTSQEEKEKIERIVRYLIALGANPYLLNYDRETVFDIADSYTNYFIKAAILNAINENLLKAAFQVNIDKIIYLLDVQKADVNYRGKNGDTALIKAIKRKSLRKKAKEQLFEVVNFLIDRNANPNLVNYRTGMNAFGYAFDRWQPDLIPVLERNGLHEIIVVA